MSGTYEPPKRFISHNDVTNDMLITKPPSDAYAQCLDVIQQNSKQSAHLSCESCVTEPCPFAERKVDNKKCSFFEGDKQ